MLRCLYCWDNDQTKNQVDKIMGGAFSCGEDNDELVNVLMLLGYIRSYDVERVFRAVDRGQYVLSSHRDLAYKDLSWKVGNIHLSAPCVYCKVMEGLSLKPGLSFLNIGSGTGYLSTMAGLILGKNGTNHGVEMHEDCLMYAYARLQIFKRKILDVDCFEFCEPVFQHGNILNVTPIRRYDRVYCGAECPQIHEQYVKQFVKIGGILVMPYNYSLLRIERIDEKTWRTSTMLPVSFAPLVSPTDEEQRNLQLPFCQPYSLQELCRSFIRSHLRDLVWSEHDDLVYKAPIESQSVERPSPHLHFGIPFLDESESENMTDDDDDDDDHDDDDDDDDDDEMIDETPSVPIEGHERRVVGSTLKTVRAVVQPDTGTQNRDDSRKNVDPIANPERDDGSPNDRENSTKDPENVMTAKSRNSFETVNDEPMEDDSDDRKTGNCVAAKDRAATNDSKMDETEARSSRPPDSKLRRSNDTATTNGEPPNAKFRRSVDETDVVEENIVDRENSGNLPDPPISISDDDDEFLNFFYMVPDRSVPKIDGVASRGENVDERISDGNPETSETSDSTSDESDFEDVKKSLFVRMLAATIKRTRDEIEENDRERRDTGTRDRNVDETRLKEGNSSKSEDSPDVLPSSSEISGDGEMRNSERTKYLRSSLSGQKRRSEEISESSTSSRSSNNGSGCSDPPIRDSARAGEPRKRREPREKCYAHKIRKDQISLFMRTKVSNLPLPLPLRIYVNYDREL